jgi:hypothetical protein
MIRSLRFPCRRKGVAVWRSEGMGLGYGEVRAEGPGDYSIAVEARPKPDPFARYRSSANVYSDPVALAEWRAHVQKWGSPFTGYLPPLTGYLPDWSVRGLLGFR